MYNPQQNGRVETFNCFLKHGIQTFSTAKIDFATGIQELLFNYRTTSATPTGKSPAELLFGRRLRTNFQPALRPTTTSTVTPPTNHPTDAQQQQQALPRFRGPYQVNDEVRVRFPQVPKGCSPFSTPRRVIEVLGNYTYKLNDGQVWNARKLVRHRKPPPQFLRADEDDEVAAPER